MLCVLPCCVLCCAVVLGAAEVRLGLRAGCYAAASHKHHSDSAAGAAAGGDSAAAAGGDSAAAGATVVIRDPIKRAESVARGQWQHAGWVGGRQRQAHEAVIRLLLSRGADVNCRELDGGSSALHLAEAMGVRDIATL